MPGQDGGNHFCQRASREDLLGHTGGLLRGGPVPHGHHRHVGYPRTHRIRATLPTGPYIISLQWSAPAAEVAAVE
jgi:hypothetical protein